jgi:hypothetical protein
MYYSPQRTQTEFQLQNYSEQEANSYKTFSHYKNMPYANRPRRLRRRRRPAAGNAGRKASYVRNRNTNIAVKALRMAKNLQKNVEIMHHKQSLATISLDKDDAFNIDGVNMVSDATTYGWAENYAGGKTGMAVYTIGALNRATDDNDEGYRHGNTMFLRSFWFKLRLTNNTATNSRVRIMLVKMSRAPDPQDFPFYDNVRNDPELETFTDKGKTSNIKRVLWDKIIQLEKNDATSLRETKYINLFRRVNTKYFYGAPTEGSAGIGGDPDGLYDMAIGASRYYLVFATDSTTTNSIVIDGNLLVNYIP